MEYLVRKLVGIYLTNNKTDIALRHKSTIAFRILIFFTKRFSKTKKTVFLLFIRVFNIVLMFDIF